MDALLLINLNLSVDKLSFLHGTSVDKVVDQQLARNVISLSQTKFVQDSLVILSADFAPRTQIKDKS